VIAAVPVPAVVVDIAYSQRELAIVQVLLIVAVGRLAVSEVPHPMVKVVRQD
jgi:hypothetical protein